MNNFEKIFRENNEEDQDSGALIDSYIGPIYVKDDGDLICTQSFIDRKFKGNSSACKKYRSIKNYAVLTIKSIIRRSVLATATVEFDNNNDEFIADFVSKCDEEDVYYSIDGECGVDNAIRMSDQGFHKKGTHYRVTFEVEDGNIDR